MAWLARIRSSLLLKTASPFSGETRECRRQHWSLGLQYSCDAAPQATLRLDVAAACLAGIMRGVSPKRSRTDVKITR